MSDESQGSNGLLPKVYDDLLSPSAKEIGGTIHGVVRLALRPVNALVLTVDQAAELAMEAVAKRISNRGIAEEKVITPTPEIANAVILGLRTAAADPDLRELFFNLLTTAMVAETAGNAHPAFVEILRQLTPQEARLIQHFRLAPPEPLLNFTGVLNERRLAEAGRGYFEIQRRNVTALGAVAGCDDHNTMSIIIDNLCRLGLFRIDSSSWPHLPQEYQELTKRPEIEGAIGRLREAGKSYSAEPECSFNFFEIRVTSFGLSFIDACTTPLVQTTLGF